MIVRKCDVADCKSIIELWERTKDIGFFCDENNPIIARRYIERNPNTSFVAELDGKIIGVIMSGHDGWLGFIHHTCVDSEFRGSGLGTKLVKAALTALKNEGIELVSMVVYTGNMLGNEFWEHKGFSQRPDLVYRNKSLEGAVKGTIAQYIN